MMIAKVKCYNQLVTGGTDCTLSPMAPVTVQHIPGLKTFQDEKKITDHFYKSCKARHKMS